MAIRIRIINGFTVALCAARTTEEPGDVYLDDTVHHALGTKFALDWEEEGWGTARAADPFHVPLIKRAETGDANAQTRQGKENISADTIAELTTR